MLKCHKNFSDGKSAKSCVICRTKNYFGFLSNCRYCAYRAQHLPRLFPNIWLTLFQISSKSVHFPRSYSRTMKTVLLPHRVFSYVWRIWQCVYLEVFCLVVCPHLISFPVRLLVSLVHSSTYCVTVEEIRPLCQRTADDGRGSTHHCPATGDDAECRVGLLQRYGAVFLLISL